MMLNIIFFPFFSTGFHREVHCFYVEEVTFHPVFAPPFSLAADELKTLKDRVLGAQPIFHNGTLIRSSAIMTGAPQTASARAGSPAGSPSTARP